MNPRLWRTAIHEAGHAVIGRVLGMVCGYATIIPNEGRHKTNTQMPTWMRRQLPFLG
jgi:hypothetical protein